jgi:deoxyribonuclease-4
MVNRVLDRQPFSGFVLMETMAGKGTEVGRSFEELAALIDAIEQKDKIGVCLDTCHVYDAGYDVARDLNGVLQRFDDCIGLDRLRAVHLNDDKNVMGSHKDRHEKIGEGTLGIEFFEQVINHPRLRKLPFFLETPNDLAGYAGEITRLRALYREESI